jgi:hypothetical protein
MPAPLTFNEGKASDAVMRRIEEREGGERKDIRLHDRDGGRAAVELTCLIAGRLFAIEHSGIEPFEGHMQLEANAVKYLQPIQAQVAPILPANDQFVLEYPSEYCVIAAALRLGGFRNL